MLGADTAATANPHVLQQRLAVARIQQEDEAEERIRIWAIFAFAPKAILAAGQVITSDFIRIARMPSFAPSIVPRRQ
jgi:hypothetical protein